MKEKVIRHLRDSALLSPQSLHLVALSGGADSVALLRILLEAGYHVEAVHCNFRLRGTESDRDEAFCQALCDRLGVSLHLVHFDTRTYAETHHLSIEMAARELRYGYFGQLRKDIGAESVCVAHHLEDSVETILLNLIRGTGVQGLTGIKEKNGYTVRPLLQVSRSEIEDYLKSVQQDFITDSTNLSTDFSRNKVRLEILPLMAGINPAVTVNIAKTAARLSESAAVCDRYATEALHRLCGGDEDADGVTSLSIGKLLRETAPGLLLHALLYPRGFTPAQTEDILQALPSVPSGKHWTSDKWLLTVDRDRLLIAQQQKEGVKPLIIPEAGVYHVGEKGKIRLENRPAEGFVLDKRPTVACMDADTVKWPLTLRTVATGDRFQPFGMQGTCLVSDYLTNRKRDIIRKRRQLVLTDAEGRILWLVGERTAHPVRITDATRNVLSVKWEVI